jgi:hypothetical protein
MSLCHVVHFSTALTAAEGAVLWCRKLSYNLLTSLPDEAFHRMSAIFSL